MEGLDLTGRRAVITGDAGGIGRAICADLASLGAQVAVADLDEAGAAAVAEGLSGAQPLRVDFENFASIDALAARVITDLGGADILVHTAGLRSSSASRRAIRPGGTTCGW